MKRVINLSIYSRLIFVTSAIAVMVGGSTFAALQSQEVINRGKAIQACSDAQLTTSVAGVMGG